MKPAEVRNLTTDEIQTRLNNAREEYDEPAFSNGDWWAN